MHDQQTSPLHHVARDGVPEETRFRVNGLTLAARLWGPEDGIPTMALHGWLDNANTHNRLLPRLPGLRVCALDFAGHGASDHRPVGVPYMSSLDVQDVLAVADSLGWEQFVLIGHSMGAAISAEFVGLFPERVRKAVLLDGFLKPRRADEVVEQQRAALQQMVGAPKQPPVYPDTAAMAARVASATDQSVAAAEELVARGHRDVPGGVTWRTDPRIRYATPNRMTPEGVDALLGNSHAESLLLVARQGDRWYRDAVEHSRSLHPSLQVVEMDGPHHVHLEPEHVDQVAAIVRSFLDLDAPA